MISPRDIKTILRIHDADIGDDELSLYITRYSAVIMSELGQTAVEDNSLFNDPLFEECLLAKIACILSRTDIEMIHAPSEYKVGDTTLKFNNTSLGLYGGITSWCDYFDTLLASLSDRNAELQSLQVFRRHGMSSRRGWWRTYEF